MKTWGGKGDDAGQAVAIDSFNNVYVTGGTGSFVGLGHVFLLKYGSNRSLLWQKAFGASLLPPSSVAVDSSMNVYIAGTTSSFNGGLPDQVFLFKVNSSSAFSWLRVWGNYTYGKAVAVSPNGSIYVTGCVCLYNGTSELVLLRFDPNGTLVWQKGWNGYGINSVGYSIAVDLLGNIYLGGSTGNDSLLLKVNSTGNLQWQEVWHAVRTDTDQGTSVAVDSSGNIVVGGWSCVCRFAAQSAYNATVSKFDDNGNLLWQRSWQDTSQAYGDTRVRGVGVDSSSNIYATGDSNGAFLLKLSSSGLFLSLASLGIGSISGGVAVDHSGISVTVGAISEPPSSLHSRNFNPTLDWLLPLLANPTGSLEDLHDSVVNVTTSISNVQGSTAYAGGGDVFVNTGLTFSVTILTPLPIVAMTCIIVLSARRRLTNGRG